MTDEKDRFLSDIAASLHDQTFVKLSLGKPRNKDGTQKAVLSVVSLKGELKLRIVFRFATRDVTENFAFAEGLAKVGELLGTVFHSGHLFTTAKDVGILYGKRGTPRLTTSKPTFSETPALDHNRHKNYLVDVRADYLRYLGVTSETGQVKGAMAAKFKQICHFVEILDSLIEDARLRDRDAISAVDIGSGKGYLTFALYDHLTRTLAKTARVLGIEARPELVEVCDSAATQAGFERLRFQAGQAQQVELDRPDIVIALHACDTATDDAIFRGIAAHAALIVCAPCCQHELAPQLSPTTPEVAGIQKFGLLKQRQADIVTDASRALLLEAAGFKVKVFEFVATEHTAKNLMIAGIRSPNVDREAALAEYADLKRLFGFQTQRLETLLAAALPTA